MAMRSLKLPDDLEPLAEMIVETFQYPENAAWSVQTDEKEQLVDAMHSMRRMWPLIGAIQALSPTLRDILRGYVWEEAGRIVGIVLFQRRGSTDVWLISTVGVLPAYRRRGIARTLLEAALEWIRARGGKLAFLSVIDGNLPAYRLYESLGFEHYSDDIDLHATLESAPPEPTLPDGYTLSPLARFDWRPRYELEKRICPETVQRYEPVEVDRFRTPPLMRLLVPIIVMAQGTREREVLIRRASDGQVVARGGYTVSVRGKGPHSIRARVDPACPELAPYVVRYLLHGALTSSPGHRVELGVPRWMEALVDAAQEAGLDRRVAYCRMGLVL